jgi:hypothetical protein
MDGTGDHRVKLNKPDSERQIVHVFYHKWNLDLKQQQQKGHEIKLGLFEGREEPLVVGEGEERVKWREYDQSTLYVYVKRS